MKTFIRATEVWVPGRDRTTLELGAGLYGEATRFGAFSRDVVFMRGEGLPGRAWQEGQPVILRKFEGSYFQRTEAAHAEGLTSGIALPIFAGEFLTSVLVIFCGDDDEHAGAIELWRNQSPSADMQLADGYYGSTGDTFETVARHVSLRRGSGLPGLAWQHGGPVFMADLGHASGFMRADSAQRVGINRGFAFPCTSTGPDVWVMTFLSALGTPIVRRFETWEFDATRQQLRRSGGFCEREGMLADLADGPGLSRGQGAIGTAALSGVPALCEHVASEPLIGAEAASIGLTALMALPVLGHGGRLNAVMAWYL